MLFLEFSFAWTSGTPSS